MTDFKAQMLSSVKSRERSIMKNVYLWMTAGLSLTGVVRIWLLPVLHSSGCFSEAPQSAAAYSRSVRDW